MRRQSDTSKALMDMLFSVNLIFFILLLAAVLLIRPDVPVTPERNIDQNVDYIIMMEWPKNSKDDVDLLVQAPTGQIAFFGRKDIKFISLDRDDRGYVNDRIRLKDGTIISVDDNYENVSIRKAIPGVFTVNSLMYNKRDKTPTVVKIRVERTEPYTLIYEGELVLSRTREEKTAVWFELDKSGAVINQGNDYRSIRNFG